MNFDKNCAPKVIYPRDYNYRIDLKKAPSIKEIIEQIVSGVLYVAAMTVIFTVVIQLASNP